MRLLGSVCQGSGAVNEDHWGFSGREDDVEAAWVLDGVTGINPTHLLGSGSDAQWLVTHADARLRDLVLEDLPLQALLARLVEGLMADFATATRGLAIPTSYDPPAACLLLAKRYGDGWHLLRLGDSSAVWRDKQGGVHVIAPDNVDDNALARAALKHREEGVDDIKALLKAFAPRLHAARQMRNRPGGYSVLEAHPAALSMPQETPLGSPAALLLCTDGYYRAVDHYGLAGPEELLNASVRPSGVDGMLGHIRQVEAHDPDCRTYVRFKPSDDAAAVALG